MKSSLEPFDFLVRRYFNEKHSSYILRNIKNLNRIDLHKKDILLEKLAKN